MEGNESVDGFWSFVSVAVVSLTGQRTLFTTIASWDATLFTPLSGAGTGELELELELEVDDGDSLTVAATAAQSLRLSASFFSFGTPGEEQEARGVSVVWSVELVVSLVVALQSVALVVALQSVALVVALQSVALVVALQSVELVVALQSVALAVMVVDGVLGLSRVLSAALDSDGPVLALRLLRSGGVAGLRNVSLLTEMNALPGVEKGRGP